jgi:MFS family permease
MTMVEKPSTPLALLLVAGLLILFFGVVFSALMSPFSSASAVIMFLDALVCGIVVIAAGILLYVFPKHHVIFGTLGLIFSIFSFFSIGGLIAGLILGIIGGALGISWKPGPPIIAQTMPQPPPVTPQPASVVREREVVTREVVMIPCSYCGNLMPQTSTFCPNCGARRKS